MPVSIWVTKYKPSVILETITNSNDHRVVSICIVPSASDPHADRIRTGLPAHFLLSGRGKSCLDTLQSYK